MKSSRTPLYLGIDTGGTYTDGVLLDPASREVVRSVKVMTSHNDLRVCIAAVLQAMLPDEDQPIALVSLSTTLATNAIAEDRRRPTALLLLGYDPDLVHTFGFERQFGTPHYYFLQGKHDLDGRELCPPDPDQIRQVVEDTHEQVEAYAVASYAGPMNASHELFAAALIRELSTAPVVEAHHLSGQLDSIRRATTASLNASLLPATEAFMSAVEAMLAERGLTCPVMMVKGDGSIVHLDYARSRPVEIIHSGPATSAIGGQYLARTERALVIDMGGTTTDLALVESGQVRVQPNAATVAGYRTCVRTIQAHSFGLGGDSRIEFDRWGSVTIGPERVLPLSYLPVRFPQLKAGMLTWLKARAEIRYADELEFWILRRQPARPPADEQSRRILTLLQAAPQPFEVLRKQTGPIAPTLVERMIGQEWIERAGLTPTDLLHVSGEYQPWDVEIARLAVEAVARGLEQSTDGFVQQTRQLMTDRMTAEIIQFLSGQNLSDRRLVRRGDALDRWLLDESLHPQDIFLGSSIHLKTPLVGIGAPAGAFLPPVARALHTELILPPHYEVANAVGTVVGNVVVQAESQVFPELDGASIVGYFSRVDNHQTSFHDFESARSHARQTVINSVSDRVRQAGAGSFEVECHETEIWDGTVRFEAMAIGRPGEN